MISSLTNQGKLQFMIYEGALKAPIFLNFLRRLGSVEIQRELMTAAAR
jgi:hypothetical protein